MTTPPKPKPVPVRIPPELVARLDAMRGYVSRESYVRVLLDKALRAEERKATRRS
jgi:metal-responsive CopG/Arc/MetJ family transcriptional regulator